MDESLLYKAIALLEGYSYVDEEQRYRATGSVTLVLGPSLKILVDTGSPWDGAQILAKLKGHGIDADDINIVVCTHGHIDHVGNLNLFQKAKHIVSHDIAIGPDIYEDHQFKDSIPLYAIDGNTVQVIKTPGHTNSDVSVVVKTGDQGTVVIVGDLFERENDDQIWREISEFPQMQEENRQRVLKMADYIVPGHGAMFKVVKPH